MCSSDLGRSPPPPHPSERRKDNIEHSPEERQATRESWRELDPTLFHVHISICVLFAIFISRHPFPHSDAASPAGQREPRGRGGALDAHPRLYRPQSPSCRPHPPRARPGCPGPHASPFCRGAGRASRLTRARGQIRSLDRFEDQK